MNAFVAPAYILTILIWASIPVVIKLVHADSIAIGIVRLVIGVIFLASLPKTRLEVRSLTSRELFLLATIGIFFALHWLTYFLSIRIASASIAVIGVSTYGIHLMLLGKIFRQQAPNYREVIAILLTLFGLLLILPGIQDSSSALFGLLLAIISGACFAVLPILHKQVLNISSSSRTFFQFSAALIFFLGLAPFSSWDIPASEWKYLLFLGIAGTVVAHTLWTFVSSALSTTTTSIIYYGWLPAAMTFSHVLLGEKLDSSAIIGAIAIVLGSLIALRGSVKKQD